MKKTILMLGVVVLSLKTMAYGIQNWEYPIHGSSTAWELHVVKNDGMNTHIKSVCNNLDDCWEKYKFVKYSSGDFQYVKKVWMERLNRKILMVK